MRGILHCPFSCLTVGTSLSGKTHLWMELLKKENIFYPQPTQYFLFGNINLSQFDSVREHHGRDKVHVFPVKEIVNITFPENSLVLVDELNSAILGLKSKERKHLIEKIANLYNELCHHNKMFVICILQHVYKTDLFPLVAVSQSLLLSTLTAKSKSLLQRAELDPDLAPRAYALLHLLRSRPQFMLIYHNASAEQSTLHRFIYVYINQFPHFTLAIGDANTFPIEEEGQTEPPFKLIEGKFRDKVEIEIDNATSQSVMDQIARERDKIPEPLRNNMFALVPITSIKVDKDLENKQQQQQANVVDPKQLADAKFDNMDKRVLDMLYQTCTIKELPNFKKLWYYLKRTEIFGVDPSGAILLYGSNKINLMCFLKECSKMPPPKAARKSSNKRKKQDSSQLIECLPFVRALLQDATFPTFIIKNTHLLALASKQSLWPERNENAIMM